MLFSRCNGLLPLWGPGVTESAFAASLARHNAYLSDVTGQRDISYQVSKYMYVSNLATHNAYLSYVTGYISYQVSL